MNQNNMDEAILAGQQAKRQQIKKISLSLLALLLFAGVSWGVVHWINSSAENQSTAGQNQNPLNEPFEHINTSELREALQRNLADVEQSVADIENHSGKQNWHRDGIAALRNQLTLAYGHYSAEEYNEAQKQLVALQSSVAKFNEEHSQAWHEAWQTASDAYEKEEITLARVHNQKTLTLNPGFASAKQLQQKLDTWDELVTQREALRIAEIENNIENQLIALEKLVVLESENQAYQSRLVALKVSLKNDAFASSLQGAINALEQGKLELAQSSLDQAQRIDSTRHELAHIQSQINQHKQLQSQAGFLQHIEVMASVDNWPAVLKLSAKALQDHPKHSEFNDYHDKATHIQELTQQFNHYLAHPERLNDSNIAGNAGHLLTHNQHWLQESPSLASLASELVGVLESKNKPMDVVFYSDGKTDIRVLGTGVVGKVKEKMIQLLPGNYRVEGRRQGYQSKIINLTVKAGNAPLSVQLICDEKI